MSFQTALAHNFEVAEYVVNNSTNAAPAQPNTAYLFHIGASFDSRFQFACGLTRIRWKADTEHDDISEEDACSVWPQVEEADKIELEHLPAKKVLSRSVIVNPLVKMPSSLMPNGCAHEAQQWWAEGEICLCARGCLDRQERFAHDSLNNCHTFVSKIFALNCSSI